MKSLEMLGGDTLSLTRFFPFRVQQVICNQQTEHYNIVRLVISPLPIFYEREYAGMTRGDLTPARRYCCVGVMPKWGKSRRVMLL